MEKWFDVPEKEGSSVICSRVRLVRNWREYPFPGKMTKEQSVEMTGRLMNGVKESGAFSGSQNFCCSCGSMCINNLLQNLFQLFLT